MPIATRLMLGFLLIILVMSVLFSVVGIQVIGNRVVSEAQEKVRTDLNAAREIYLNRLGGVFDFVRLNAERPLLRDALISGTWDRAEANLKTIADREKLDVLTITDRAGIVLKRIGNRGVSGDDRSRDELIQEVLAKREAVAATATASSDALKAEAPRLAEQAVIPLIDTPKARSTRETALTSGLMLKAAAPLFDDENRLIGVVYGGVLLNRNFEIVDKIKRTVFQNVLYEGKDIGTATIFLGDVRVSTNVHNQDGSRAIGTRIAEDVYRRVVEEGQPWIGRAFVVNDWYITAYEPIRAVDGRIVGVLYVGLLEQKYQDMKRKSILTFLSITLAGVAITIGLSWLIARSVSVPARRLVTASKALADGNLDAKVEIASRDEIGDLADHFNRMAVALKQRDEMLKDRARRQLMESERLALVGRLAADVAHEINNPLQGIVAYAHLLLEDPVCPAAARESLQKIVAQADRCKEIVRGLLDFSRPKKPHVAPTDIHGVLRDSIELVARQARLQNIEIVRAWDERMPRAAVDPSQMQQVFVNLIINAAEAMEGGGRMTVTTRSDPAARWVEVEFRDTGRGISGENLERIFDPFFTTKEVGRGTGLGLSISYGIVKENGGTIVVESEAGRGATFTIRLPAAGNA
jgi:two-component system NtrC family sensor kinase